MAMLTGAQVRQKYGITPEREAEAANNRDINLEAQMTPEERFTYNTGSVDYQDYSSNMLPFDRMNYVEPHIQQFAQQFSAVNPGAQVQYASPDSVNYANFGLQGRQNAPAQQQQSGGMTQDQLASSAGNYLSNMFSNGIAQASANSGNSGSTQQTSNPSSDQQNFINFLEKRLYEKPDDPSVSRLMLDENIRKSVAANQGSYGSVRGSINPALMAMESQKQRALTEQRGGTAREALAAEEQDLNDQLTTKKEAQFMSALEANRLAQIEAQKMRRDIAVSNAAELNRATIAAGSNQAEKDKIRMQAEVASNEATGRLGSAIVSGAGTVTGNYKGSTNTPTVTSSGAYDAVGGMTVKNAMSPASTKDLNAPLAPISSKDVRDPTALSADYKPVAANTRPEEIVAQAPEGSYKTQWEKEYADQFQKLNNYTKPFTDPNIINENAFRPTEQQSNFMNYLGNKVYNPTPQKSLANVAINEKFNESLLANSGAMRNAGRGQDAFLAARNVGNVQADELSKLSKAGGTISAQEQAQNADKQLSNQQDFMKALEANRTAMMTYERMRTDVMIGNVSEATKAQIASAAQETERQRIEMQERAADREQQGRYAAMGIQIAAMIV